MTGRGPLSLACLLAFVVVLANMQAGEAQGGTSSSTPPVPVYSAVVVSPTNPVSAGRMTHQGLAVDSFGNVYLAENATSTYVVAPPVGHGFSAAGLVIKAGAAGTAIASANVVGSVCSTVLYGGQCEKTFYVTGIAVDEAGNEYVAGPLYDAYGPSSFVMKLAPDGALFYAWRLSVGGVQAQDIAIDASGNAYVAGNVTRSYANVDGSSRILGGSCGTGSILVTKLNPLGPGVIYSTCISSASAKVTGITVDAEGNLYAAGQAGPGFPTTQGAFQPGIPAGNGQGAGVVFKLNPAGSAFVYSTYLGGSVDDIANAIGTDAAGSAYITGTTESPDFPVVGGVQNKLKGTSNAFVAKLNPAGSALVYSTYLGGSATENGSAIALDGAGNAWVAGATTSADFPLQNAIQSTPLDGGAAFVVELNASGSALSFSTYVGGRQDVRPGDFAQAGQRQGLALDARGNIYISGYSSYSVLPQFPAPGPIQMVPRVDKLFAGSGLSYEGTFVVKLAPAGTILPVFGAPAITNAASFQSGAPASGIAALFGSNVTNITGIQTASSAPLPAEIAGTSVIVDGVSAPLFGLASINGQDGVQQINFQVPANAANPAWVVVNNNGIYSSPVRVNTEALPAVFTLDGMTGAIQHAVDYSLVTPSNPAGKGEAIAIYATGLGAVAPDPGLGNPAAISPLSYTIATPTVTMGGKTAQVLYSGLTPGAVGLNQINVIVPADAPSGDVDVVISLPNASGVASSKAVKLSVR